MGRGGPPEPELLLEPPTTDDLVELARSGRHAASDYLEDAALAGTVSIGARRCGGGLAGAVAVSNVHEAASLALERGPELVIFEGSGAALPPIASDRRVLVMSAHQDAELACGYLNAYRILVSDLVVISFAEPGDHLEELRRRIALLRPGLQVIATEMLPCPFSTVRGKKTALFTTAPDHALAALGEHLARRAALRKELAGVSADVFCVELKAAAVDVVIEEALARGCEVVLSGGELVPLAGEAELEPALLELVGQAIASRVKIA